jgi:hypothetical protein
VGIDWLDMQGDSKLTFKTVNNIFFDGTKQRERSTQIRVPVTSTNNRVLNYLQKEGTGNTTSRVMNCEVYTDNVRVLTGSLRVLRADSKGFSVYILGSWATLDDVFNNLRLRDLSYPFTPESSIQTYMDEGYPARPLTGAMSFVFKPIYFRDWAENVGAFNGISSITDPIGAEPGRGTTRQILWVSLCYVIDRIAHHAGLSVGDCILHDDAELRTLYFYQNIFLSFNTATELPGRVMPDMSVIEFIDAIEKAFCCEFSVGKDKTLNCGHVGGLADGVAQADWTSRLSGGFTRVYRENDGQGFTFGYDREWVKLYAPWQPDGVNFLGVFNSNTELQDYLTNPSNFEDLVRVPDGGTPYVERVYNQEDSLCFVPNENHWFVLRKQWDDDFDTHAWYPEEYNGQIQSTEGYTLGPSVATVSDLPDPTLTNGVLHLVLSENWYYGSTGTDWRKAFYHADPVKVGDGARELVPKLVPVMMDRLGTDWTGSSGGQTSEVLRVPAIKNVKELVEGQDTYDQEATEAPLMLAFRRGIRQSTDWTGLEYDYPYLSSDEYERDGTVSGNYSLLWHGPRGRYAMWWERWADVLMRGRIVECSINMSVIELAAVDLARPVLIRGMKCMIMEMAVELPLIAPVKFKMLRV